MSDEDTGVHKAGTAARARKKTEQSMAGRYDYEFERDGRWNVGS